MPASAFCFSIRRFATQVDTLSKPGSVVLTAIGPAWREPSASSGAALCRRKTVGFRAPGRLRSDTTLLFAESIAQATGADAQWCLSAGLCSSRAIAAVDREPVRDLSGRASCRGAAFGSDREGLRRMAPRNAQRRGGLPSRIALATYAAFFDAGRAPLTSKTPRSPLIASHGLARRRIGTAGGRSALDKYSTLSLHRGRSRSRAVPGRAVDGGFVQPDPPPSTPCRRPRTPQLPEWRVRKSDGRSTRCALAAIRRGYNRADSRWTYFRARCRVYRERRRACAYRDASLNPEFHGSSPLTIDNRSAVSVDPQYPAAKRGRARPGDRARGAVPARSRVGAREWDEAVSRFDDTQRVCGRGRASKPGSTRRVRTA